MFEREPNIDIVFRNGLRDLEVLPPSEIWDNIPPVRVRGSRYKVLLGMAAGVAALVTFTLFASWFTRSNRINTGLPEMTLAENDPQLFTGPFLSSSPIVKTALRAEIADANNSAVTNPEHETAISGADGTAMPLLVSPVAGEMQPGEEKSSSRATPDESITIISQGLPGTETYTSNLLAGEKTEAPYQRFLIGASMVPSVNFSASGNDAQMAELLNGESIRTAYSTGLAFGYKVSRRLTIQSGIGFSSMGQIISGIDVYAGLSDFYAVKSDYLYRVQTSSGTILTGNPDLYLADSRNRVETMISGNMADPSKYPLTQVGSNIHQVFRYLELPLLVRYKVIDRGIGINFSGGMSYGLLVDNLAYTGSGSEMVDIGHTEGINMHSLSSQIGLGMEYNISGRFTFNLEPVFRYYVTPFSDLSGTLYKPYSFGLFSGFFYKF